MADKQFTYTIDLNNSNFQKTSQSSIQSLRDITLAFNGVITAGKTLAAGVNNLIKAYDTQKNAELAVTNALNMQGIAGEKYNKILFEQAAAIQRSTTVGDEAVLSLQAYSLTLGNNASKTDEMTKKALGLSKVLRIDQFSALEKLTAAEQGNYNVLAEKIPLLRTATSQQQAMAEINKIAAAGWQQVTSETETSGGSFKQMANIIGDLQEVLGGIISDAIYPAVMALKELITYLDLRRSYEIVKFVLAGIAGAFLETFNTISHVGQGVNQTLVNGFITLKDVALSVFEGISTGFINLLSGEFSAAYDAVKNIGTETAKVIQEAAIRQGEANQSFIDAKTHIVGYFDAMSTGYEQLNAQKKESTDLTEKDLEAFNNATTVILQKLPELQIAYRAYQEDIKTTIDLMERQFSVEGLGTQLDNYSLFLEELRTLRQEDELLNLDGLAREEAAQVQSYQNQIIAFQNMRNQNAITQQQYERLAETTNKNHNKKLAVIDEARYTQQANDMQMAFGLAKNLAKEGGIAYRITASAEALIATLLNATKLSYNPVLSALTMANGFANIAKINGVGFQAGGFTGFGADDEVAGMVHRNEVVIPAPVVRSMGVDNAVALASSGSSGILTEIRDSIRAVSKNIVETATREISIKSDLDFMTFTKSQNEAVAKGNYDSVGSEVL